MFYKKKSNILFRKYDSFGYITDNRNFGYIDYHDNVIGDKILSETGSVFFELLGLSAVPLKDIIDFLNIKYPHIDSGVIKKDVVNFFDILEYDGFVVSGRTIEECEEKDWSFSYHKHDEKIFTDIRSGVINNVETEVFFEKYFDGKPQLTSLHIEVTGKCNEKCIHCYIPHDLKLRNIDSDLFYEILKQAKDLNVLHVTLSGGEPMLHKDFCGFLKKCREYNFSVSVLTNLTLLDDIVFEEMRKNKLLSVQVSLYSMQSDIHNGITKMNGSLDKTKKAILKLLENDVPVQISCPIMKQNKEHYKDVLKWAKGNLIKVSSDYEIIAEYNNSRDNLNCRLSLSEIKDILNEKLLEDSDYLYSLSNNIENNRNAKKDDRICSVCYSSICISENGKVYPCPGWQGYVIGDIKERTIKDIWENGCEVNYLRNLQKKDSPVCVQCENRDFCSMCMVRNSNENLDGNPLVVNRYFCEAAKITKEIFMQSKINIT